MLIQIFETAAIEAIPHWCQTCPSTHSHQISFWFMSASYLLMEAYESHRISGEGEECKGVKSRFLKVKQIIRHWKFWTVWMAVRKRGLQWTYQLHTMNTSMVTVCLYHLFSARMAGLQEDNKSLKASLSKVETERKQAQERSNNLEKVYTTHPISICAYI